MKNLALVIALAFTGMSTQVFGQDLLVYEGQAGIGKGKHIVFIANDHEYRSEQTCPLVARMLAKEHGFKCTVLFGVDDQGYIKPGSGSVPGMEVLKDADLVYFFTRFMSLPDNQIQPLADYLEKGGPIIGIRTSTHCFNGQKGKWSKLNFNHGADDYRGGMGEQVFGNTWHKERGQLHYGSNHQMGCTITPIKNCNHPILAGIKSMHAYSGAYLSRPPKESTPLLEVQVLNTFGPSEENNLSKPKVCAGWTRNFYFAPSGDKKEGRVVYTSMGASEDMLDAQARRFMLNACLWALNMEDKIQPDLSVEMGKYKPTFYTNGVYVGKVKPTDLAGWDAEIMPGGAPITGLDNQRFRRRAGLILSNRPEQKKRVLSLAPDLKLEKK